MILLTLGILSWFVDEQVSEHFSRFAEDFMNQGLPMTPGPRVEVFLQAIQKSMFLTMMAAAFFAILISFMTIGYFTSPIKKMIAATKAIADGKYQERIPVESHDELGDLMESLNSMAEALDRHRYLQEQLLINVSHELATPLTNIGGYLEALEDDVIKKEKQKEVYGLMHEETERLKKMLRELRALPLLEKTQFQIHPSLHNIEALCKKVIKQIQPQFDAKKVSLRFVSELESKEVLLDKDRSTQILLNLLNNALQYTPAHKSVLVHLTQTEKETILSVEDEGQGIPAKALPYIFERFYRVDASRNRKTGGVGIGLAIVKELVEAHGGRVEVTSTEGKGSRFSVYFLN
jgi:signal transduction histidine kinase